MMTTGSLVSMHHLTETQHKEKQRKKIIFLVMGTLRICSLNAFPVHHTAVLAIVITLCITSQHLFFHN